MQVSSPYAERLRREDKPKLRLVVWRGQVAKEWKEGEMVIAESRDKEACVFL